SASSTRIRVESVIVFNLDEMAGARQRSIARGDLGENTRRAYRLQKKEIAVGAGADAWFPSGHDAYTHRWPPLAGKARELPSTAVRQANIGHEDFIRRGRRVHKRPRLL